MKIEQFLVHLYPHTWRERYEEEFLAMLEQRPLSLLDGIDILFGALNAHLHPELGTTGLSLREKMVRMISTLRHSLLAIFCAYVAFILAGGAFQKMTESGNLVEVARTNSMVDVSFRVVVIGAFIALSAMLVCGLPVAVAVIRSALTQKRYGPLFLLAVPFLAFAVFLGTLGFLKTLSYPGKHLLQAGQMFIPTGILSCVLIVAAIVSAGAVCFAVTHSEISEKLLHFAVFPLTLTTTSMALMLIATIVWGLSLHDAAPHLFAGNNGLVRLSTTGTWLEIVIVMAIATVAASFSLLRGLSARSALRATTA